MHDDYVHFILVIMSSSHELYDESMRRQQELWLLELHWREQGQICSHMLYDVVGIEEVTLIVKRGYSLTIDDLETLPY